MILFELLDYLIKGLLKNMSQQGEKKLLDVEKILHKAGVGEKMRIADLGCGSAGHFVFPAASIVGKEGEVYAVDILKNALENIKRKVYLENIHNVIPVWSNLEIFKGTKLEAGSLDVALLVNTLYQFKHRTAVLREAVRMLKKRGVLVIVEWRKISLPFGPRVEDRVDPKYTIQVAQKLGLDFEEEFFVGKYHYGLIFNKL